MSEEEKKESLLKRIEAGEGTSIGRYIVFMQARLDALEQTLILLFFRHDSRQHLH